MSHSSKLFALFFLVHTVVSAAPQFLVYDPRPHMPDPHCECVYLEDIFPTDLKVDPCSATLYMTITMDESMLPLPQAVVLQIDTKSFTTTVLPLYGPEGKTHGCRVSGISANGCLAVGEHEASLSAATWSPRSLCPLAELSWFPGCHAHTGVSRDGCYVIGNVSLPGKVEYGYEEGYDDDCGYEYGYDYGYQYDYSYDYGGCPQYWGDCAAYIWDRTQAGLPHLLPVPDALRPEEVEDLYCWAISADGSHVAGTASLCCDEGTSCPIIWSKQGSCWHGKAIRLTHQGCVYGGSAVALSEDGAVAAINFEDMQGTPFAAIYKNDRILPLPFCPHRGAGSIAATVSNDGALVGGFSAPYTRTTALLWEIESCLTPRPIHLQRLLARMGCWVTTYRDHHGVPLRRLLSVHRIADDTRHYYIAGTALTEREDCVIFLVKIAKKGLRAHLK